MKSTISINTCLVLGAILLYYLLSFNFYKNWNKHILVGGDTWGYYLYLPALFIHDDLENLETSLAAKNKYMNHSNPGAANPLGVDEVHMQPNGNQVNKYTCGVALLQAPFFFLAHAIAQTSGQWDADGYSTIYNILIMLSSIFYTMLGLLILAKILSKNFDDGVVILSLLSVALITNLYFFCVYLSGMAHSYLFFLYALLVISTINFYGRQKLIDAVGIGFSCGMITLIRPTEIICIIIPIFYGLLSIKEFALRLKQLIANPKFYLSIIVAITIGFIQLFYWYEMTGNWLHYSYNEEGFNFLRPKIKNGLFSFKNGWLSYTPIMYFALFGIVFLFKNRKFLFPVLLFLSLHIYIIYSWHCWNYINGFGSRPMVETYALLSIPMAFAYKNILSINWLKYLFFPIVFFLFILIQFNMYQLTIGVLWTEEANWNYYKEVLFKTKISYKHGVLYDSGIIQPDEEQLNFKEQVFFEDFNQNESLKNILTKNESVNDKYLQLSGSDKNYIIKNNTIESVKPGDWLKLSFSARSKNISFNMWVKSWINLGLHRNGRCYKCKYVRIENKINDNSGKLWGGKSNEWGEIVFYYDVPSKYKTGDKFVILIDSKSVGSLDIDNVNLSIYEDN